MMSAIHLFKEDINTPQMSTRVKISNKKISFDSNIYLISTKTDIKQREVFLKKPREGLLGASVG